MLAQCVTSRPLNRHALALARHQVIEELGQGALVEAAGVVGVFEMMTKLVDATGKQLPRRMFWLGQVLVSAIAWIVRMFQWLGGGGGGQGFIRRRY
jgi:hypothetical protein